MRGLICLLLGGVRGMARAKIVAGKCGRCHVVPCQPPFTFSKPNEIYMLSLLSRELAFFAGPRLQEAVERPEAEEPYVAGAKAEADIDDRGRHEASSEDDARRSARPEHAADELAEPWPENVIFQMSLTEAEGHAMPI